LLLSYHPLSQSLLAATEAKVAIDQENNGGDHDPGKNIE
jgi:hypothetical protein